MADNTNNRIKNSKYQIHTKSGECGNNGTQFIIFNQHIRYFVLFDKWYENHADKQPNGSNPKRTT